MTDVTKVRDVDVLVIDDEKSLRFTLCEALGDEGYRPHEAEDGTKAMVVLREHNINLVLLDLRLQASGEDGLTLLRTIKQKYPHIEVIMMTAFGKFDDAVEATKAGCYQFLAKPFKLDQIRLVMAGALEHSALRKEVEVLRRATKMRFPTDQVIGQSPKFLEVLKTLKKVAKSPAPILLLGETGAGKEVLARALHRESSCPDGPMVEVNCSAFPESLLESELFGHERGAFTDARDQKQGVFELAHRGTLFLDEIGDMNVNLQAKLLRVLETGTFKRVGGTANIEVQVRVVAATNRNLKKFVSDGGFREDLYYRLAVVPISIPPLRERRKDIIPLAEFFLQHLKSEMGTAVVGFSAESQAALLSYPWPGNVRELRNVVERAVLMASGTAIECEDLPQDVLSMDPILRPQGSEPRPLVTLGEAETAAIESAMHHFVGNKTKAADALGITRGTLRSKLKHYGLSEEGGH